MTPDLPDPTASVLDILTRAANEKKSPWRWPVLVTRGETYPGARMLVVRHFDRSALEIELHTDARSAKITELQRDPACALLFFDKALMVQLRIDGRAAVLTGADAEAAYSRAPEGSLSDYTGLAPGDDPDAPASENRDEPRENLAALRIRIERADLLKISRNGHDRRFVDFTSAPPQTRRAAP